MIQNVSFSFLDTTGCSHMYFSLFGFITCRSLYWIQQVVLYWVYVFLFYSSRVVSKCPTTGKLKLLTSTFITDVMFFGLCLCTYLSMFLFNCFSSFCYLFCIDVVLPFAIT